ncbi:MAG TPA: hypothetical protein VKS79_07145 [Gemmataceae bacterium]|nr:hypothetical protein [Gemmataceae bacterium]
MRRPAYELILAFATIAVIGLAYGVIYRHGLPRPGGPAGHSLGIFGFLLMLSTEVLYTLRKRWKRFRWGRMPVWLKVHVFTGVVGPFLVLLHTAGKLHGVAGAVTLLTLVIVASGFIGRYIYAAVPRTVAGTEKTPRQLELQITLADNEVQSRGVKGLSKKAIAVASEMPPRGWKLIAFRVWLPLRQRWRLHSALQSVRKLDPEQAQGLEDLFVERYRLLMQINSLALAKRMLGYWHLAHVPLGVVLFTLAFVHVGAAMFYSTFLK